MKHAVINQTLTLYFPESVSTANAEEVAGEAFALLKEFPELPVEANMEQTTYLSSAGLRVLLKLQKSGRPFAVTEVSTEVYEIFDMTGFVDIMKIVRRRRKISLENTTLIGEGFSSKVYRISEDSIVKVFIRDTSLEDIERELKLAKKAFVLGIPTAISYDVVDVDGKYGVIFELINCGLLRDAILDHSEQFEEYMQRYVKLLLTLNTTDVGDTVLPDFQAEFLQSLQLLRPRIAPEDFAQMEALVRSVPAARSFVHGDCHVKNIMYSGSELLLIDMDTLSYGNPIFELAKLYMTYMIFSMLYPNNIEEFFRMPEEMGEKIMQSIFRYYYSDAEREEKKKTVIRLGHIAMMIFLATYSAEDKEAFAKAYDLYKNL